MLGLSSSDQKRFELSVAVKRLGRLERAFVLQIIGNSGTCPIFDRRLLPWYSKGAMNLRDFAQYIKKESTAVLLHRARKASLKRIMAHEATLEASRKKPAKKRTGSR
jgi:hypothetical protein